MNYDDVNDVELISTLLQIQTKCVASVKLVDQLTPQSPEAAMRKNNIIKRAGKLYKEAEIALNDLLDGE